jgi:hypothetical protein
MGRLRVITVGLLVGIFLTLSYLLDVALWFLWPSLGTERIREVLLPGFRWIDPVRVFPGFGGELSDGFLCRLHLRPGL